MQWREVKEGIPVGKVEYHSTVDPLYYRVEVRQEETAGESLFILKFNSHADI